MLVAQHDQALRNITHEVWTCARLVCVWQRYQAGDKEAAEWSESTFFFAPPESLAKSAGDREAISSGEWGPEVVKMGVFGDMGTAEVDGTLDAGHSEEVPSLQTVAHLKEQLGVSLQLAAAEGGALGRDPRQEPPLSLVLHIGDLSYARGYDAQWDEVRRFRPSPSIPSIRIGSVEPTYSIPVILMDR